MSHSPDLASWRWMNWLRCSSADSGNSSSLVDSPWDLNSLLNSSTDFFCAPEVSLPVQYVTSPFALSIDAGSMTLAPFVVPVSCVPALPPPVSPSSSPQPATRPPMSAAHPSHTATCRFHLTVEPLLLVGPWTVSVPDRYPSPESL